jgi:hypothetical protein
MEKEFIPYKQAVQLKELGFNEPCFARYYFHEPNNIQYFQPNYAKTFNDILIYKGEEVILYYSAPLYQQAFKWFRDKYGLNSISPTRIYKTDFYQSRIINWNTWEEIDVIQCSSYEEAELECIKKLIEIANKQTNVQTII